MCRGHVFSNSQSARRRWDLMPLRRKRAKASHLTPLRGKRAKVRSHMTPLRGKAREGEESHDSPTREAREGEESHDTPARKAREGGESPDALKGASYQPPRFRRTITPVVYAPSRGVQLGRIA